MNKQANLFAGVAIVIAISLVVYIGLYKVNWDKSDTTSNDSQIAQANDRDIFSYVPADTIFFFGGLSTVSFEEAANVMTPGNEWMIEADWSKQFSDEEKKLMPPAALILSISSSTVEPLCSARNSNISWTRSVLVQPGRTELNRIPSGPSSSARDFVRPTVAALMLLERIRLGMGCLTE